jgi:hypothetical protein
LPYFISETGEAQPISKSEQIIECGFQTVTRQRDRVFSQNYQALVNSHPDTYLSTAPHVTIMSDKMVSSIGRPDGGQEGVFCSPQRIKAVRILTSNTQRLT